MKYLEAIDYKTPEFGDLYDELPLWSAPFGLVLRRATFETKCNVFGVFHPRIRLAIDSKNARKRCKTLQTLHQEGRQGVPWVERPLLHRCCIAAH